ncbi:nucleotidyl cyclase domain-containing protein [Dactylosporangium cerinum]
MATSPVDGTDGETLIAAADRRNYLAKRRGRGQAVGDDVEASAAAGSSRLWERDAALSATQEFLTRVAAGGHAALRIVGPPGAGHTRFLREVAQIARLRGFPAVLAADRAPGCILLVDVGDPLPELGDAAAIVYATTSVHDDDPRRTGLREAVVELTPGPRRRCGSGCASRSPANPAPPWSTASSSAPVGCRPGPRPSSGGSGRRAS